MMSYLRRGHAPTLLALAGLAAATLAGCATIPIEYVPRMTAPDPNGVVITVIPADLSRAQTDWAAHVQMCLLWHSQRVIERPPVDETETRSEAAEDERLEHERATDVTVDVVATYAKSEADVIVASDYTSRHIKFIDARNQRNELIASGQVPKPPDYSTVDQTCLWIQGNLPRLKAAFVH